MTLQAFILGAMTFLAPGRDHSANATAIADVVEAEPALFKGDADKVRTAAIVVAIAFRESSFRNDVVSKTDDYCLLQVNRRPDLARDARACVRVGLAMLRESMRVCPAHPVAHYAEGGTKACSSTRAQAISRDRMAIAARLVREVKP